MLTCACVLVACSDPFADGEAAADNAVSPAHASGVFAAIERVLDSAADYPTPEGPIQWPRDTLPHPSFRAESWQLMAILEDEYGIRHSVLQQLDRVGLRDVEALDALGQDSDWLFRDVMRGSVHILSQHDARRDWQNVQRVSLGLAGVTGIDEQSARAAVHVSGLQLRIDATPPAAQMQTLSAVSCATRFSTAMPGMVQLVFKQQRCGEGNSAGPLRVVNSPSLSVTGEIDDGRSVHGTGWIRHAFGDLPGASGPVVFDTALLEIETVGLLMISRSKRRSGNGPRTLQVQLHGQLTARFDDLVWQDLDTNSGNAPVPSGWRVQSASGELDVMLEPVAGDAWIDGPGGRLWRGAVSISGSHSGSGFVDFQPVSAVVNE